MSDRPLLTDPWTLGSLRVPNRVLLAPLAGIGNWFVRLQAKRHGAGMAVSEMVSSHAIHYRNERTLRELLRIHPEERAPGPGGTPAPTSIQLFGQDPAIMRSAAAAAVRAGADAIDINMGCPVPKVCRTGSGAALLGDPALAVSVARAAVEGAAEGAEGAWGDSERPGGDSGDACGASERPWGDSECAWGDSECAWRDSEGAWRTSERSWGDHYVEGPAARACAGRDKPPRVPAPARGGFAGGNRVPVTVKLRSGQRPGDTSGFELAQRLVHDAGVAAIAFHPRSAAVHHKGVPDYELAARLAETLPAPVILTGGLHDAAGIRAVFAETGVAAVMLARGALGNPWLFEELVGDRARAPTREEVLAELRWTIARAVEHLGPDRAARYMRKFYPWYVVRLGLDRTQTTVVQAALQASTSVEQAGRLLEVLARDEPLSALAA